MVNVILSGWYNEANDIKYIYHLYYTLKKCETSVYIFYKKKKEKKAVNIFCRQNGHVFFFFGVLKFQLVSEKKKIYRFQYFLNILIHACVERGGLKMVLSTENVNDIYSVRN